MAPPDVKLLVVSHKLCWQDEGSPGGFSTDGGFPRQVAAISSLFDQARIIVCRAIGERPSGLTPVGSAAVDVATVEPPSGSGWVRKLSLIPWLGMNGARLWQSIREADAVHTPVPGDVGAVALLVTLAGRKRLFVRHCGTWGDRSTLANRFLAWLLPRIAGRKVVVMATGGGPDPPEPRNLAIQWIFATSLSQAEYDAIVPASPWKPGEELRLVTVGRLTEAKNALACIEALPEIRTAVPDSTLDVVGDGPFRAQLENAASRLGLADTVTFTGNLSHEDVLETLCRSNLFLFPTRVAEGFPKAVLEAMACGLPVVASRVSVLPHLLGDGCGVLLDGTEATEVADAVIGLTRSRERIAVMGREARAKAGAYTLERWRDLIRERLEAAWDCSLKDENSDVGGVARPSS